MRNRRQSGITIIGMTLVVFLVMFFTLLFFKLLPPYLNNFKVNSDLANLIREPDAPSMSLLEVTDGLDRRFEIDGVSYVHLSKDLTVTRITNGRNISIVYSVQVPLIYNVSAVVAFNDHVEAVKR